MQRNFWQPFFSWCLLKSEKSRIIISLYFPAKTSGEIEYGSGLVKCKQKLDRMLQRASMYVWHTEWIGTNEKNSNSDCNLGNLITSDLIIIILGDNPISVHTNKCECCSFTVYPLNVTISCLAVLGNQIAILGCLTGNHLPIKFCKPCDYTYNKTRLQLTNLFKLK